MSEGKVRIALVGHCGPDSYALRSAVGSAVPGVESAFVNDERGAIEASKSFDLLLVNRSLDGRFESQDGVELIGKLAAEGSARMMLVSNYPDAQAAAEEAGALPGFGKATMYSEETRAKIQRAITPS